MFVDTVHCSKLLGESQRGTDLPNDCCVTGRVCVPLRKPKEKTHSSEEFAQGVRAEFASTSIVKRFFL